MQVAVVGAGAVGCYYGGLLARAGHDVTFIGRRTHVDAINAHGLLLDTQVFKRYLPARAATDASSLASPDLVLFCVKSADTEEAGRSLAGRLRTEASVLSLQNGVDNPQRLRAVTGHPVIPAVVYVGSEMVGPGHVKHHGGGALVIGASPESQTLAETLKAADIQTTIADDIERIQWSKLATNCAFNALSAVAGISYGPMLEVEGTKDVVASAVQEVVMVARACGVSMPEDLLEQSEIAAIFVGARFPRGAFAPADFLDFPRGAARSQRRPRQLKPATSVKCVRLQLPLIVPGR